MNPSPRAPRLRFVLPVLAAGFLLAAGCVPVGWLPDSSGFLYITGGEKPQVMHYDIGAGKKRVVLRELPAGTLWPSVSPDGKRFAAASLTRKGESKQWEVRVLVHDLQGKQVHSSPALLWREDEAKEAPHTAVFWAKSRDKLVLHDWHDQPRSAIYDLEKKTFQVVEGMPAVFGGTPLRPDDKGFLVWRQGKDEDRLEVFLIDWAGKEQAIPLPEEVGNDTELKEVLQTPWLGTAGWDGAVAQVAYKGALLRIDTEKKTSTLGKAPKDPLEGKLPIVQRYDFAGDGARVRVVEAEKAGGTKLHRLLLWKPGAKQPETVLEVKNGHFHLSPSPDGKWLAVRAMGDDLKTFDFLLVGRDGTTRLEERKE
jgi:hypothetical protein